MSHRYIIIKTGHSETWIDDVNDTISFGDVVRSTTIIKNFDLKTHVIWFGSSITFPLIPSRVNLEKKEFTLKNLQEEMQDSSTFFINLEKNDILKSIFHPSFKNFCGFFYCSNSKEWKIKNKSGSFFNLIEWNLFCLNNNVKTWGEKIHFLMNIKNQPGLGYLPSEMKIKSTHDIGLNWQVGNKWPSKQIPIAKWKELDKILALNFTISWQEGFNSLDHYLKWIKSCRLIITSDSLGMHLAMIFNIPTIALFSATSSLDIDRNSKSVFLNSPLPDFYQCQPCYKNICSQNIHCSEFIDFNMIKENAIKLLNE
jgi:heptosyltransferase-2